MISAIDLARENLKRTIRRAVSTGVGSTDAEDLLRDIEHLIDAKLEKVLVDYQRKPPRY